MRMLTLLPFGEGRVSEEAIDMSTRSIRPMQRIRLCPARDLAAAPRPFVRLLGLTNRGWPRRIGDNSILPNHILPASDFDAALSGSTSMLATKIYFELMVI